jgi:hypothetical protein
MTPIRFLSVSLLSFIALPISSAFAETSSSVTATITPLFGSTVVPQGAQRVPLAKVEVTAPCTENVTVSSLTFKRTGLGASSDFQRVYVMQAAVRKSRGIMLRSKESSTRVPLRSVSITKCNSAHLTVYADMSATADAGGQHSFEVTQVETSLGNAAITLAGSTNKKNALQITPSSSSDASVSAEFRPVLGDISYGQNVVVARLLLKNTGNSDLAVSSITFTNEGSASDKDLQNFLLETPRVKTLSKILPQMDGKSVTMTLDPAFILGRGDEKLLQLRADVRASRRKTIEWSIEEPSDIQAVKAPRQSR